MNEHLKCTKPDCKGDRFYASAVEHHTWIMDRNASYLEDHECHDSQLEDGCYFVCVVCGSEAKWEKEKETAIQAAVRLAREKAAEEKVTAETTKEAVIRLMLLATDIMMDLGFELDDISRSTAELYHERSQTISRSFYAQVCGERYAFVITARADGLLNVESPFSGGFHADLDTLKDSIIDKLDTVAEHAIGVEAMKEAAKRRGDD